MKTTSAAATTRDRRIRAVPEDVWRRFAGLSALQGVIEAEMLAKLITLWEHEQRAKPQKKAR